MTKTVFIVLICAIAVAVPLHPAFADTVDANAQPYMVGGGFIAGVLLIGIGIIFIQRGRGTRRLARASTQWPVTDGKILAAHVATKTHQVPGSRYLYYVPQARYSYEVAGRRYEGDVIRAGIEQFGYGGEVQAQAQIARYPVGATVPVHYDPDNPSTAVLEAAEVGGARNILGGGIFVLLGISAFVFAVWISTLTPV